MIYLLKNFKKRFINNFRNFYNDENGNAVSTLVIFNFIIISLISVLLFFIYGWESSFLREEISDVVMREIYSTSISRENILNNSNEYIQKLETLIKDKIKEKFYSYSKKALLRNLSDQSLYETKETDLIVKIDVLNYEININSLLIKIKVELKFVFPLIFLMRFVKSDTFIRYKNDHKKIIKKRRVNFVFEEIYTIY